MPEFIVGMGTLQKRLDAISGPDAGKALMTRVQLRTLAAMKHRVPRKTSNTSRTLHGGPVTPNRATILGSVNALWLDKGTKRHFIPKNKNGPKVLRFAATAAGRRLSGRPRTATQRGGHGGLVFAKWVDHPGTKAQPFIAASVTEAFAKSGLADVVVDRWNKAG